MADTTDAQGAPAQPQRKRLVLKPRSEEAAKKLEAERQAHLTKANPFGAAKPREAVIAEKLGKTEEEVLKEEVTKEKLHLRLSGAQLEEKRQAETEIKEIEEVLALEAEGSAKHAELTAELKERQKKLDDLMESFAKVTLETALSGGAPRVSQIRQQQQLTQQQPGDAGYAAGMSGSFPPRSSFGGREFNDAPYGGGRGGGPAAGAPAGDQPRGFRNYQQRGGFSDSYQERQGGSYGGGRRGGGGGGQRLPEWALDDSSDAGFYDAPAATSAFIASGGYQGGGAGYSGGGRGSRGGGGGGRRGGRSYGDGGYGDGYPSGRGLGGEFEYKEEPSSFGAGQDRF